MENHWLSYTMGLFSKKKEMVELSEVQKRSINLPHGKAFVPKDGYGFVDLTRKPKLPLKALESKEKPSLTPTTPPATQSSGFSFFDTPSLPTTSPSPNSSSNEELRKISMQISDLDTKLYKMEQRIELLERKAGVSNSDSSSTGGFSW